MKPYHWSNLDICNYFLEIRKHCMDLGVGVNPVSLSRLISVALPVILPLQYVSV